MEIFRPLHAQPSCIPENVDAAMFAATDRARQQVREMLALQDEMNRMVDPQWTAAGFAWHRAMYAEAVELMEHLGAWKWWKAPKAEANIAQIRLELIDIWHFALSWYIVRFGEPVDSDVLVDAVLRHVVLGTAGLAFSEYTHEKHRTVHEALDRFIADAGLGLFAYDAFFHLCACFGLTFDDLHAGYIAKNALNRFRQLNGYKRGTYIKTWRGQEDNEVLDSIVQTLRSNGEPVTMPTLLALLDSAYRLVTEPTAVS
jgi:dimeric dUTPase (all-alpha-NTP-PPase superfamily)